MFLLTSDSSYDTAEINRSSTYFCSVGCIGGFITDFTLCLYTGGSFAWSLSHGNGIFPKQNVFIDTVEMSDFIACSVIFLAQNLCSKIALITSTIRVTMVELVPKIVFSLLFLDSCFKWNFLLTSTMSIGFLVLSCSSSISFRNSVSSYSCTLIKSLRCKFRLFCLRMILSSISTPDVNTCWFRLERHPGVRLIMLKPSIRIFSCLLPWQFMKRSV